MSRYEGMNGNGVAKQSDLRALRTKLMEIHNQEIQGFTTKQLEQNGLAKANTRTRTFEFVYKETQYLAGEHGEYIPQEEPCSCGYVTIEIESGTFSFRIPEQNHAMDDARRSAVYGEVIRFIKNIPENGTTYGAETYEWSEYDEDGYGNKAPGVTRYYGSWKKRDPLWRRTSR